MRALGLVLILCVAVGACQENNLTVPPSAGLIAIGTWGGDSAGMIVGDSTLHLHIACTYGDVAGRVALAPDGSFDVAGSYLLRAYPIAVGPTMPARFVGHVDGGLATVTVVVSDTVQHQAVTRGPVVVKYGDEPRLGPCPICDRAPPRRFMHLALMH